MGLLDAKRLSTITMGAMGRTTHRPWTSPHCPRIHGKAAIGAERYTRTEAEDNDTGITDKQRKGGQSRDGAEI